LTTYITMNVPLDDFTVPVTVDIEGTSIDTPSESGFPPNTRYESPICEVDGGENALGSLKDDFYLLTDDVVEFNRMVLWSGDTGSQDGTARLRPVACADLENLVGSEGDDLETEQVAAVLFYAWLVSVFNAEWGYDDPEVEFIGGSLLDNNALSVIANSARNKEILMTSELFPEIIQRRRKAEEEERKRRKRRPSNKKLLCTIDIWDDFLPTTEDKYHIQFLKRPTPRYRLWKEDRNYWTPTDCYTPAEDDLVSVGKKLLRQYFRRWPSDAAGHSAGEILSDSDIDDLIKSMP